MKEVLFRLGQVAWWIGTLGLTLAGCAMLFILFKTEIIDRFELFGLTALVGALWTASAWALSYVLAGSFWRRPKS